MDTPRSLEASSAQPIVGRLLRAFARLELSTQLAMVCVLFGWFFMNTLVVNLGSLEHGVRFFDMSAVIADPTRLFFGVDASAQRLLFGLACVLCLLAPVTSQLSKSRLAWLAWLAPLGLIVLCGLLLYTRTSGEFFAAPGDAGSMSGHLINFANQLARRSSDLVSRHIAIGAGGYLAGIGAVVLAVQGVRRFRRAPG
jgi:hypothetical protein